MKGLLTELAEALEATLHGADRTYAGASIDTRQLSRDALFFALPGSRVDGHEFVSRAASLGAAAAVVDHVVDTRMAQLEVADVEAALQRAGAGARRAFEGGVVGVTGSNGKTTVKQMLAAILAEAGGVLATEGNLNNHLGVPLTLMRLDASAERAVIEMGASHPGEIAMLGELARPTVGVVTNAGLAHLEGFGSREGVARAKGELYACLGDDGVAVVNADDDFAGLWLQMIGNRRRCLRFSLHPSRDAEVRARALRLDAQASRFELQTPAATVDVALPLAGEHNVANALAAAASAVALNIDAATIARGLANMAVVGGRLAIGAGRFGARLVDDSYNANPGSLAAALGWLGRQPGTRWAVLGDMGELGNHTAQAHRDAGTAAREAGIDRLWVTGEQSRLTAAAFGDNAQWFADHTSLNEALLAGLEAEPNTVTVLVKGSRSARMDRIADALRVEVSARAGVSC